MNGFEALVLGLVQGFTEFLPVSSSGTWLLSSIFWDRNDGRFFRDHSSCCNGSEHGGRILETFVGNGPRHVQFQKDRVNRYGAPDSIIHIARPCGGVVF